MTVCFFSLGGLLGSDDGLARERKARVAACMGLRIISEQAAQLAKQGSMIPHLYPERQLSKLHETPPPLGMPSIDRSCSFFLSSFFLFSFSLDRSSGLSWSITLHPHFHSILFHWSRIPYERRGYVCMELQC